MTVHVFCESAELMVEAVAIAGDLGLAISPELSTSPWGAAARAAAGGVAVALSVTGPGLPDALTAVPDAGRVVFGWLGRGDGPVRDVLRDLGIACVSDVGPALSAAAWLASGASSDLRLSGKRLHAGDRARLGGSLSGGERAGLRLASLGAAGVGLVRASDDDAPTRLGPAAWVREAGQALRASERASETAAPFVLPTDLAASRDVLFGPPRTLSDPASKAALTPFGLPLPQEELCASPSRAASEAARIGFPVRIALASPDLRVWDHPELSIDGVDNAARVRDIYRQLMSRAAEMSPNARILGVSVTATTLARALLRLRAEPLGPGRVAVTIGFADPHGYATRDTTMTVLPASRVAIERAILRLRGHALLLGAEPGERQQGAQLLTELLAQLGSFVDTFREEVERVELNPVAVLVGGGAEVREAAVQVTDKFLYELG